jgi:AraC family transcriptional regulator
LKNKEAVYKSLEIIEQNLKSDMTVYSLCSEFDLSLFYFSRLFKGVTGYSPKSYILHRKISEAAKAIVSSDSKIIEIAYDFGFSTPESFSRAFNSITGINPSDLKKQNSLSGITTIEPLSKKAIENKRYMKQISPEIVTLPSKKLVGIPFYHDVTQKNDLSREWANLIKNIHHIQYKIEPEKYYQVQYWFEDQDPGTLYFFICTEVVSIETIPIQMTAKVIPEQKYLKFYHQGRANSVGKTYQYIYEEYLPETDYSLPYFYNFEYYGEKYIGPYNDSSISEIYIPIK